MNTPICDFVKSYCNSASCRLHMPGHKGKGFLGVEHLDITEIDGADVLYNPKGIILKSEQNASELFGTKKTVYSAEGSSLSIRAMMELVSLHAKRSNTRAKVLAGRNAHSTFLSAAALLDIDVEWIYPENRGLVSCKITAAMLENSIKHSHPTAVFITSPDYLGNIADIKSLAEICHRNNVLLLVDNAHGAYLKFLQNDRHPITLGADVCCDSAHKTLPVLTGGGYLHISHTAPDFLAENANRAMSIFASTSPSYLILQSLDLANEYLSGGYIEKLAVFERKVNDIKSKLQDFGYILIGSEPLKITISTKPFGYTGMDFAGILKESGIVCEFYDPDFVVLMLTPEFEDFDLKRIFSTLTSIAKRTPIKIQPPSVARAESKMSVREAMLAPSVEVDVKDSVSKTLAMSAISCPPAIPIAVCGEVINEQAIECFKYYGVEKIQIVQ